MRISRYPDYVAFPPRVTPLPAARALPARCCNNRASTRCKHRARRRACVPLLYLRTPACRYHCRAFLHDAAFRALYHLATFAPARLRRLFCRVLRRAAAFNSTGYAAVRILRLRFPTLDSTARRACRCLRFAAAYFCSRCLPAAPYSLTAAPPPVHFAPAFRVGCTFGFTLLRFGLRNCCTARARFACRTVLLAHTPHHSCCC